ncbi:hypothetical protein ACCC88_18175 [Sphingomonas sp. Sphisp140]|uniref:hypothetical protein n=1 Tax=unclassified Sphingomonas TaxID=196159 RepID=UPI0039AEB74A
MGKSALLAISSALALAAIALPGWAVLAVKPDVEQLQAVADRACKCERRSGSKACWQPLARLTRQDLDNPGATTCFPLSTEMIDAGTGHYEDNVALRYRVVGGHGLYLCSKQEAVVGEAIWAREMGQPDQAEAAQQRSFVRANAALIHFATALQRGERLEKLKPLYGCVTGYPR